ncbi:MAG: hypothetical protein ACJ74T_14585, partial [Pyrinomonadaceae bacterium]
MKNIRPRFSPVQFFSMLTLIAVVACVCATTAHVQRAPKPRQEPPTASAPDALMDRVSQRAPREEVTAQVQADADEVPGPSLVTATSYPFAATTGVALEDMSSGTTQLVAASLDDNASAVTNIGFEYWYDGVRATQFSANANGLLRLGATAVSTGFTNSLGSTTDAPKIGAYWDDQCTGANGKVHFKVTGSAPNRKLIVEWQNMQITRGAGCAGNGNGTYQV